MKWHVKIAASGVLRLQENSLDTNKRNKKTFRGPPIHKRQNTLELPHIDIPYMYLHHIEFHEN